MSPTHSTLLISRHYCTNLFMDVFMQQYCVEVHVSVGLGVKEDKFGSTFTKENACTA